MHKEHDQRHKHKYAIIQSRFRESKTFSTPEDGNTGRALRAAETVGADTEHMAHAWWAPTMRMPVPGVSNMEATHQAIFDVGRPHSLCVNREGRRFVDESCGYDQFGLAMIADNRQTDANLPCWMIFDVRHRNKFTSGGLLPSAIMPDKAIPPDWWDHYFFKANSIAALADKIGIDRQALEATVNGFNAAAKTGVDGEFGRGDNAYDQFFGDPAVAPNPCLGGISEAPFYAIAIHLGDLGTKGGLKADTAGRVLDTKGQPIGGLYAAGNAAGSVFGNCYPGAGATIGPAVVYGYLAAEDIAAQAAGSNAR